MSSIQESETGSGFINTKYNVPVRTTLHKMVHKKVPTPIQFYNKRSVGIITYTFVQSISKATDMQFYWIHDRQQQNQIHIHWKEVKHNIADYPTNHHSTKHHIEVQPTYLLNNSKIQIQNYLTKLHH